MTPKVQRNASNIKFKSALCLWAPQWRIQQPWRTLLETQTLVESDILGDSQIICKF